MKNLKNSILLADSNNEIPSLSTGVVGTGTLLITLLTTPIESYAQNNYMAPNHPCIATQIQLVGDIGPQDTVGFILSGIDGANLGISDDLQIRLRKMVNGIYDLGPIAVTGIPGDTLVIIGTGAIGESEVINYFDFDCDPAGGSLNVVLPITLVSFDAYPEKDSLVFVWKTAQETNVAGYEGQVTDMSSVDRQFKTVVSQEAGENNQELREHRMTVSLKDAHLIPGRTYAARLQNVDIDGQTQNSPIVTFEVDAQGNPLNIELVPNPVSAQGTISLQNLDLEQVNQVYLGDMTGTAHLVAVEDNGTIDLSKYNLSTGVYVLTAIAHDGSRLVNKRVIIAGK